jgi:hypothetical protein
MRFVCSLLVLEPLQERSFGIVVPFIYIGGNGERGKIVEPATGIELATCGLRNFENTTSDNLTPQETTNQPAPDMGLDGARLSCPGSSVVADASSEDRSTDEYAP